MKKWGFLIPSNYRDSTIPYNVELISYYDKDIGVLYEYESPHEKTKIIAKLVEIEKYYPSLD